jgi:hypothetical protein
MTARRLGEVLDALLAQGAWAARLGPARVLAEWPRLVGPEVARHAVPVELRRGILWVAVRDGLWATQLAFLKGDLLARLREGPVAVRDVRFDPLLWGRGGPLWPGGAPARPPEETTVGREPGSADGLEAACARWREAARRRAARGRGGREG